MKKENKVKRYICGAVIEDEEGNENVCILGSPCSKHPCEALDEQEPDFNSWLKTHSLGDKDCSWRIQNAICTILGPENKNCKQAIKAWEEQPEECKEGCLEHKYHCGDCNSPLSYSPANYASRPTDIPNPCEKCVNKPQQPKESSSYTACYKCGKSVGKDCECDKQPKEPTLWEEFNDKFRLDKERNQWKIGEALEWFQSKLLELAGDLRMEKEDERPEITEWLVSEDYTKGYNKAVEEHNKRLDTFISKLNG